MRYADIQQYMKAKKLGDAQMASLIGLSQSYVNQLKNKKRTPGWRVAMKLKKITGIPLERLIGTERTGA